MFFILSKTLGILTIPSNVLGILVLVGLILLRTRWARAGRRLLIFCLALFLVVGTLPQGIAVPAKGGKNSIPEFPPGHVPLRPTGEIDALGKVLVDDTVGVIA